MGFNRDSTTFLYYLFSRLFANKTTRNDLQEIVEIIKNAPVDDNELLQKIQNYFEKSLNTGEITAITREYTRLFHLPQGVNPYESVYRGQEPLVKQDPWVEVRKFYRERGWYIEQQANLEDHVAVELSFMGHLLAEGENKDARDFFLQHLGRWALELMKDISQNRHADFYGVVSGHCLSFLEKEKEYYEAF